MAKYTWWLQNCSVPHGNLNTTASAVSSKRHSLCFTFFFFFSKGRKGLMPVEGLFLLQFSHHLHNITHTFFNKSRWDVNPHRAGCQLPGELPCNYAALLPKPSAGKVWMLGSISDRVISSNPNKKKEHCFYLSCFYLLPHHNFTTFLHTFI